MTDMNFMFGINTAFNNSSISNWNTSKVTNMKYVLSGF
jgi:surface protein